MAPVFDAAGNEIVPKSKTKAIYESQESHEKLYLAKLSSLQRSAQKVEYVCYSEVFQMENVDGGSLSGSKHFLKDCTAV